MAPMTKISEKIVAALPVPERGNRVHYFSNAILQGKQAPSGFAVRVTSSGAKSFVRFYRVGGRPHIKTLGRWSEKATGASLTVLQGIIAAQKDARAVRDGADPRPERTRRLEDGEKASGVLTVTGLIDRYVDRMRKRGEMRTVDRVAQAFDRLVKPRIGKLSIYEVKRRHIVDMLDGIEDSSGPVMADRVLSYVRAAFKWRAIEDDDLTLPFIPGMTRTKPRERARARILSDDEIRAIWRHTEGDDPFSRYIRFLLLTSARRSEASRMTWPEITGTDWVLPAARNKVKTELVRPLSAAAMAVLPKRGDSAYVFTLDGRSPLGGVSRRAAILCKQSNTAGWIIHDLRRTARSLMARAGVPSDHAERCLGHALPGVRGVYDRHLYHAEMTKAYEALAGLVGRIVVPKENVKQFSRGGG
jgi:integrase